MSEKWEGRDWLVYIPVMGGGTWYRDPNLDKAITEAKKRFKLDWSSLLPGEGTAWWNAYDVTGYDRIHMGDNIWAENDDGEKVYFDLTAASEFKFRNPKRR